LTFPFVARRASQKRAKRSCGCLSDSEFHSDRPIREAQGSPKGRVARAISFGSFSFSQKKMNKKPNHAKRFHSGSGVSSTRYFFSPDR